MLERVIEKLKSEEVDYNLVDDDSATTINFGLELSFSNVNIEISYDKNEKLYRFYSELVQFNDDSYEDGAELVNDINFNSLFVKAYLDDENVSRLLHDIDTYDRSIIKSTLFETYYYMHQFDKAYEYLDDFMVALHLDDLCTTAFAILDPRCF